MVAADDRPLEQGPYALDGVRMDLAAHPLIRAVSDRLMARVLILNPVVALPVVRHDGFGLIGHYGLQKRLERDGVGLMAVLDLQPHVTAALDSAENHRHVVSVATSTDATALLVSLV